MSQGANTARKPGTLISMQCLLETMRDNPGAVSPYAGAGAAAWALTEIDRLNKAIRGAQIAFCHDNADAAMAILVATGVQNAKL